MPVARAEMHQHIHNRKNINQCDILFGESIVGLYSLESVDNYGRQYPNQSNGEKMLPIEYKVMRKFRVRGKFKPIKACNNICYRDIQA